MSIGARVLGRCAEPRAGRNVRVVPQPPSGTVTFLFTDIEGSTRRWESEALAMREQLARHDAILRGAVEARGGHVLKSTGDGVVAVFGRAGDAVEAAVDAQLALCGENLPAVRMGVHTGEAEERDGDYFGPTLNRAARLMAIAHGGQVVVSSATEQLVDGVELIDLGEHRLRDLSRPERVFQLVHADLPPEFPPLRSVDSRPGNLPREVTTFVGRGAEISMLSALVRERPLVTLTGVGGVGKTRLAVQVAAEVLSDFRDGAWVCELAPVVDPGALWETLAACFGVNPAPGRQLDDVVIDYLVPKRLLLVLDNCEHLLDVAARAVDRLRQRCPEIAVLATSREGLALAGEQIVAVPPLGLPSDDDRTSVNTNVEAVQLFVDRARDAKRDFVLSDQNAGAVALLCRRLDGIPLAIELAAARVRSLTPDDLVQRLDQRFKLLTRGSRASLERHQTLRNTVDWSYDLLNPVEQAALNRLSVFAGGADLRAVEAVVSGDDLDPFDVADVLGQLVDKSLVLVDDDERPRYRLLETIRQYAQERLEASGEAATVRRRHAEYYVTVAEQARPDLRGRKQVDTDQQVTRETDNFRAALDWSIETESAEPALRLVAPLAVNGMTIGYRAFDWAATACAIPGATQHRLYPTVASWAVFGLTIMRDLARAEALTARIADVEDKLGVHEPAACQGPAVFALFSGDLDLARKRAGTWVERARGAGDIYETATALVLFGTTAHRSHLDSAVAELEEAVCIARDAHIASALPHGLNALASSLPADRDAERITLWEEAIEIGNFLSDKFAVASAGASICWDAAWRGDWSTSLARSVPVAEQFFDLGILGELCDMYYCASRALARLGHYEPAAILLGAGDARFSREPGPASEELRREFLDIIAATESLLQEAIEPDRLRHLSAEGAAMPDRDLVEYLRAEASRALGDP